MSAVALVNGLTTVLRAIVDDPQGRISGVQPDGEPPPFAGQVYYAVHWTGLIQQDDDPLSLDEVHAVAVTITYRMANVPGDRRGAEMTGTAGLLSQAQAVGRALHHKCYDVMGAANALVPGSNGFVEPPHLRGIEAPQKAPPDWMGEDEDGDGEDGLYLCVIRLAGARLAQPLADDT